MRFQALLCSVHLSARSRHPQHDIGHVDVWLVLHGAVARARREGIHPALEGAVADGAVQQVFFHEGGNVREGFEGQLGGRGEWLVVEEVEEVEGGVWAVFGEVDGDRVLHG